MDLQKKLVRCNYIHDWPMTLAHLPHICGLQRLVEASHFCSLISSPARLRINKPIPLQQEDRRHAPRGTHRPSPPQKRRLQDFRVSNGSEVATAGGAPRPLRAVLTQCITLHPAQGMLCEDVTCRQHAQVAPHRWP